MTLARIKKCGFGPPHAFPIYLSNSQHLQHKIFKQKSHFTWRHIETTLRVSRRDAPESLKENLPP